ncbi:hypothetical protein ACJTNH_09290 [Modestobacter lacusdianchii]
MSMSAPFDPVQPSNDDQGIPAADAGQGSPPPAEGFGIGGEEPDAPEQADEAGAAPQSDTPFRTPDPDEVGPEATGNPVDPAVATNSPDPGQTGRDQR